MAKKVISMWKPPTQIKLADKDAKKKSKFYFPSPDSEVDDVFVSNPEKRFGTANDSYEFDRAQDRFFKKYNIPDEGKREFVEIFFQKGETGKQLNSRRLPVHSMSSVGLTSSPRYKETRMSLPSLSARTPPIAPARRNKRKESAPDRFRTRDKSTSTNSSLSPTCVSFDVSPLDNECLVNDDECVFHHRCRSTALDLPLNQFQVLISGLPTIVIADNSTIILHGPNAELVSKHQKIALKLSFDMTEDIIRRMVNVKFLEELGEMMLQKGATPLEIGKGCIEIWLSFANTKNMNAFKEELYKEKIKNELIQLLLRHGYMREDDRTLKISVKEKKIEKSKVRDTNNDTTDVDSGMVKGMLHPINFMMNSYDCSDVKELDTILSENYKKMSPFEGFTSHFSVQDENKLMPGKEDFDSAMNSTAFPTLLHFAAYYGLPNLCACLSETPGFSQAKNIKNKDGLTPVEMMSEDTKKMIEK